MGVVVTQEDSWGRLVDKLLSDKVEPNLVQPTFLVDYPVEMSPLAKGHPNKAGYVERFEGFIAGMEICNAFTELNDPIEQRRRFEEQEALRLEHSEEDFDRLDEEFLTAVEYGMPPTGGVGIGIDRLAMLFSGQSTLREVVLFPHLSISQGEAFLEVHRRFVMNKVREARPAFNAMLVGHSEGTIALLRTAWEDIEGQSWRGAYTKISFGESSFPREMLVQLFHSSLTDDVGARITDMEILRRFEDELKGLKGTTSN